MKHLVVAALVMSLGAAVGWSDEKDENNPPAQDARFAFLKKLEGTWVLKSNQEDAPEVTWSYRTTSSGSAVVERIMIGTPMEMMTVYHMNGKKLEATHYCALGNQPHYMAKMLKDGGLEFVCDGRVSNAESHDDHHMHRMTMRLAKDGKLQLTAEAFQDGKVVGDKHEFVLARSKSKKPKQ